jgi:hypothetical protein
MSDTATTEGAVPEDIPTEECAECEWEYIDPHLQNRLWLKAIGTLLSSRVRDTDPSPRVQLALDLMFVEACERARRILRSDVTGESDNAHPY